LIVDRRAGSKDLYAPLLQARIKPLELGDLTYGDIHIQGNGPGGCPWNIGIEHKKIPDMIQSIDTGRLVGHQLPGMLDSFNETWIVLEGEWRVGSHGEIMVRRERGWSSLSGGRSQSSMASTLLGFLITVQTRLGVKVWHSTTQEMTVAFLSALNRWWTAKEYDEHRSHLAFDTSSSLTLISKPSLVRRVAKELPGIGWERSGTVARHFGSVIDLATATETEWAEIEGIGKTMAKRIVNAIDGGK